ncbi:glycosyltransferase family 2 protein [Empedobacter falsenii]|uniref:Glycosyltransferase n=1 Tax=Empedobacter falsenii TaxID=343874 RepID=A0AAW7DKC2_9FLAO|nr:glycosyltransferase [Empedobacter falsenii]MDM1552250.1 glycosyltransferase [Empedobacter falsenii]
MKISIIIVTYNSIDLIDDCLNSIYTYNDLERNEIEIIIVDNSSTQVGNELKDFLINHHPDVLFIKNQNLGYGQGNNVGVKASSGDIIAVMNPDVRITEQLFKRVEAHFNDLNVASLGFQQINSVTDFSFFRFPELFFPILYSFRNRRDNQNKKFNQKYYSLSGAFVFFRKKDFIEAGMYDENMFMYLEEPDIASRINNLGKKIVFDPSVKYIHLMDHKDNFNEKLLDIGTESIAIYFTKKNLNLQKYIHKRILELELHELVFKLLRNKNRVEKAKAYKKSLKKADEFQKRYLNNK